MDYVDRLKQLRKERGLSQEQVADLLQCERSMISKYETRRSQYNVEQIVRLCEFYGISADRLLGLEELT